MVKAFGYKTKKSKHFFVVIFQGIEQLTRASCPVPEKASERNHAEALELFWGIEEHLNLDKFDQGFYEYTSVKMGSKIFDVLRIYFRF